MKTEMATTSLLAYRQTQEQRETLLMKVAKYCLTETKAGRPVWISKIAEHLDLEKSTASARLNDLKKEPIEIDGNKYSLVFVRDNKPDGEIRRVQQFALILLGEQIKMFK